MAFPFFSLAKSRRVAPIDFRAGGVTIRVEGTQEHGIATIWDADLLIWAASQIVEARDAGLHPSRWIRTTPYEILRFIGRGVPQRLSAPESRAGSAAIDHGGHIHPRNHGKALASLFMGERMARAGRRQRHAGIELILPDWFYAGVLDAALVLTIDPAYFRLKGGIERWLYRLVRKHGGRQARLAIRLPAPVPQVGQRGALLGLCLRPACLGGAAVVARPSSASRGCRTTERSC